MFRYGCEYGHPIFGIGKFRVREGYDSERKEDESSALVEKKRKEEKEKHQKGQNEAHLLVNEQGLQLL